MKATCGQGSSHAEIHQDFTMSQGGFLESELLLIDFSLQSRFLNELGLFAY